MSKQLICNRCGHRLLGLVAYVVLPLWQLEDQHYHVECWKEMQRKAENSNPSAVKRPSG